MTNFLANLFRGCTHRISHTSHELYLFCSMSLIMHLRCVSLYNGKRPLRTPSFFQQSPHQLWEVLVPEAQDRHCRLSHGDAAPLMVVASVFPDPVAQGRCLSFVSGHFTPIRIQLLGHWTLVVLPIYLYSFCLFHTVPSAHSVRDSDLGAIYYYS